MLERNAKYWENPLASTSTILASGTSISKTISLFIVFICLCLDQHQPFSKRKSIVLNDIQSDETRSPLLLENNNPHQLLEPRMQNNPLPLHNHEFSNTRTTTESTYNHELLIAKYDKSDEEEEGSTNEQYYKTQFINEPQHHLTYKPHIDRKRRRGNLPKHVTEYLKHWLLLHKSHPYPTEGEKQKLADETGLFVNQISNWFINARRRILQPLLDSEDMQQEGEEIDSPTPDVDANDNHNFISNAPFASSSTNIHFRGEESSSDHRIRSSYTGQNNHNYLLNEPSEYNADDDPTHSKP